MDGGRSYAIQLFTSRGFVLGGVVHEASGMQLLLPLLTIHVWEDDCNCAVEVWSYKTIRPVFEAGVSVVCSAAKDAPHM